MVSRPPETDFERTVEWLYSLRLFGAKLGLENVRQLSALAGNPQEQLRFVHIAGTNGKGSTCAMIESIYRQAGWRTGLFTSPHLVRFGERVQVNRQMISETDVIRLVDRIKPWLKTFPSDGHPTFFEVVTVLALCYFVEQQCELVIWETGMGGRLDATNIVTPEASVITTVAFDHERWLGTALEEIAFEKAGIIKPGVPVITGAQPNRGLEVIERTAQDLGAPLIVAQPEHADEPLLATTRLSLLGEHQRQNAKLALALVRTLESRYPVTPEQARAGLESVKWEGRLQHVQGRAGQKYLLDGAHNPSGAAALANAVDSLLAKPRTLILGLLEDKDGSQMCGQLAPLAERILTVPIDSERSARPEQVAALCREANPAAEVRVCRSLAEALSLGDRSVLVTGSLHLVGAALEQLQAGPADPHNERRLNDYVLR